MYRVIIVDDEILIRKRIRLGFDWAAMGYEIAGEAEDGVQALEKIRQGKFDLAIVDIAMPAMNGLELIRKLREAHNEIRVVLLTGHSDFAYAKEAIRYGVRSYILKPINEEEFTEILEGLRGELDRERAQREVHSALSEKQTEVQLFMEFRFLSRILSSGVPADRLEESRERAALMGMNPDAPFHLLVLQPDAPLPDDEARLYADYTQVEGACRSVFGARPFSVFFHVMDAVFVCALPLAEETDETLKEEAQRLTAHLEEVFGCAFVCGVSGVQTGLPRAAQAYRESRSALHNVAVYGEDVVLWERLQQETGSGYRVGASEVKEFQKAVIDSDGAVCAALVQKLFAQLRQARCRYEDIVMNVNRILVGLGETCSLYGLELRWLMECSGPEVAFEQLRSLGEMEAWLAALLEKIVDSRSYRDRKKKDIPLVSDSCAYLKAHSADAQLTQAEVAEALGVSAAYLSALFKKSMGISMMNYLMALRLEHARALLTGSRAMPVREVAEQAGYNDEFYFSRCFKKYYGLSPAQVRKELDMRKPQDGAAS